LIAQTAFVRQPSIPPTRNQKELRLVFPYEMTALHRNLRPRGEGRGADAAPPSRRGVLLRRAALAGAALAGFVAVALLVMAVRGPDPEELEAYGRTVHEVALAAGTIIEMEMKPGMRDIREEAFPPQTLASFAERWAGDLERIRSDLATVPVPRGLGEAQRGFVDSLAGYVEVADLLREASLAPPEDREAALEAAADRGAATDQVWNDARDELGRRMEAVGLISPLS
jgi:hypothetical protein